MHLVPARPRARHFALALALLGALSGVVLHPSAAHAAIALSTPLVVTSTGDSGMCGAPGTSGYTLRCAIDQANLDGSMNSGNATDTIAFAIPSTDPGCSSVTITGAAKTVCKISPASDLPALTANNVTINGYSQSSASASTNLLHSSNGDNAILTIQLDGASDTNGGNGGLQAGLRVEGSTDTIKGLSITNFGGVGIELISPNGAGVSGGSDATSGNVVAGDFIGVAPDGSDAENSNDNILVLFGSTANTIGGTDAGDRNVIGSATGNGATGVNIETDGNTIEGNYLGTAPNGTHVSGFGYAVELQSQSTGSGTTTRLGGAGEAGNVINGASTSGAVLADDSGKVVIEGNYIGTDAHGDAAITPNPNSVANNGAGITTVGAGPNYVIRDNLVSGNQVYGIEVDSPSSTVTSNKIGTDATGTRAIPNDNNGIDVAASNVTIGGSGSGDGNLISGNASTSTGGGDGIRVESQATNTTIEGNTIGVDANGAALGNGSNGIFFDSNGNNISPYVQTVRANTIAYNGMPGSGGGNPPTGTGVQVGSNGYTSNIHVRITQNAIFENANHGIILDGQNPDTCSDPTSSTSGQPLCPVIDSATTASVSGHAPGCGAGCTIEVFVADTLPSDNGHGEGRTYLGSATTDSTGHWTLASTNFARPLTSNDAVTATTTRGSASDNTLETSAFSGDSGVTAADATATSPADTATPTTPASTATSPASTATSPASTPTTPADTATATSPVDTAIATTPADTATSPVNTATSPAATATTTASVGGGGGPPSNTPELGSGELLATGLIPLALALLYRRRTRQTREHSEDTGEDTQA